MSSNLYSQGFGSTSSSSFAGNAIVESRSPSQSDVKGPDGPYPIGKLWVDTSSQTSWQLMTYSVTGGIQVANWSIIGGSSSTLSTLSADSGTASPVAGNIEILGGTGIITSAGGDAVTISIASGSDVITTLTGNSGGAISPSMGNINVLGSGAISITGAGSTLTAAVVPGTSLIAQLNADSGTAVPVSGVVKIDGGSGITTTASGNTLLVGLTGGGSAIQSIDVDAHTAPGTDPVVGNAGAIQITGGQVAAGTTANVIRTNSLAANEFAVQVQRATTAASSTVADNGVCHFNSSSFSVDSNGFVSLVTGETAVTMVIPNSGTNPVLPDGSGDLTIVGTGSLTTVGGTNSLTLGFTGLTNHNVLIGQGNSTLGLAAPTAVPGLPLVSAGVSADPAFGTAVVLGGGTGTISFTPYGPVVAGSNANAALSSVAPSFTSGIPFISQGSASNPAFGTAVVAGGGTGSTSFNTYGPVVAGSSSGAALTSISPSSTTGIPFVSQGAGANPSFSTAVVAGGGTGNTSTVAYAPLCGGTTTTGALQAASTGMSTSGFVLTSNGASTLPSWQLTADSNAIKTINGDSGTATPSGGAVSITASGTGMLFTGSGSNLTFGGVLSVPNGGTGQHTFSTHGIIVGEGTSSLGVVPTTATAGQVLQSAGSSADPSYSTATYPSTTTASQLLYSSSTNTVGGLATANSAALVTNSSGVPAFSGTMTNGQLIIGSTGGTPSAATITAGNGISVTNGAGSISIGVSAGFGLPWTTVTGATQAMTTNNGYISNASSGTVVFTLPATSAVGDVLVLLGKGTSVWQINVGTGQQIVVSTLTTTISTGNIQSNGQYDCITLQCLTANTLWVASNIVSGGILVV